MFDIVDTALSYERELIVCSFLQGFSRGKGSSLQLICNAHTAFFINFVGQNSRDVHRVKCTNSTLHACILHRFHLM